MSAATPSRVSSTDPSTAATTASANPALYTPLGVAITGVVTLATVFLRYWLDRRSEARKHDQEVVRLHQQLHEQREDQSREDRRKVFASFLVATSSIYQLVNSARKARREAQRSQGQAADAEYRKALATIDATDAQFALEECRMLGRTKPIESAEELWAHLRGDDVAIGADLSAAAWTAWRERYWLLRKALVDGLREDLSRT